MPPIQTSIHKQTRAAVSHAFFQKICSPTILQQFEEMKKEAEAAGTRVAKSRKTLPAKVNVVQSSFGQSYDS